jgi:hypothetical protein
MTKRPTFNNLLLAAMALALLAAMVPTPSAFATTRVVKCFQEWTLEEFREQYDTQEFSVSKFKLNNNIAETVIIVKYGKAFDVKFYTKGCEMIESPNKTILERYDVNADYIKNLEKKLHIQILDSNDELIVTGESLITTEDKEIDTPPTPETKRAPSSLRPSTVWRKNQQKQIENDNQRRVINNTR